MGDQERHGACVVRGKGACAALGCAGGARAPQEGPEEGILSPSCACTSATSPGLFCLVTSSSADREGQGFGVLPTYFMDELNYSQNCLFFPFAILKKAEGADLRCGAVSQEG